MSTVVAGVVFRVVFAVVGRISVVFYKNNIVLWYWIISVSAPGMASQDAFCGQVETFEHSVFSERFKSILRAGRSESAGCRSKRGDAHLIETYQKYKGEDHGFADDPESFTFLTFHWLSSLCRSVFLQRLRCTCRFPDMSELPWWSISAVCQDLSAAACRA